MSDDQELIIERHGNVLVARLNRPEARNALSPTLLGSLGEAVLEAEGDVDIRALVLTGTGDRSFCAGMDLRSFAEGGATSQGDPKATEAMGRLFRGDVAVPIVGAANATAVAGGLELLLASDVIVVSSEAKFGLPEVTERPSGGNTAGPSSEKLSENAVVSLPLRTNFANKPPFVRARSTSARNV